MPREDGPNTADDFSAGTLRFRLPEGYRWPRFMQQMVVRGQLQRQDKGQYMFNRTVEGVYQNNVTLSVGRVYQNGEWHADAADFLNLSFFHLPAIVRILFS